MVTECNPGNKFFWRSAPPRPELTSARCVSTCVLGVSRLACRGGTMLRIFQWRGSDASGLRRFGSPLASDKSGYKHIQRFIRHVLIYPLTSSKDKSNMSVFGLCRILAFCGGWGIDPPDRSGSPPPSSGPGGPPYGGPPGCVAGAPCEPRGGLLRTPAPRDLFRMVAERGSSRSGSGRC